MGIKDLPAQYVPYDFARHLLREEGHKSFEDQCLVYAERQLALKLKELEDDLADESQLAPLDVHDATRIVNAMQALLFVVTHQPKKEALCTPT